MTIQEEASYILASAVIDVGLNVKCQGGSGEVVVNVTQSPPETPYPVERALARRLSCAMGTRTRSR